MAFAHGNVHLDKRNICSTVFGSQLTGRSVSRISQVPDRIIRSFAESFGLDDIPALIKELDNYSCDPFYDPAKCLKQLKRFLSMVTNFEARRNTDPVEGEETSQGRYCRLFIEYEGVDILVRLLMFEASLPLKGTSYHRKDVQDDQERLRVKSLVLEILIKFISQDNGEDLAKDLTQHEDLINYCFMLLIHEKTYLPACQLLEDLLQARRQVLNLNSVHNLKLLVACLDDTQLANFCRVLAVTISDLDIYENKSSLYAQNKQKRSKGFINVRDINQELLLGMPDLLPRLIKIATGTDYMPRYRGMVSELDCWMEWIEQSMATEAATDGNGDVSLEEFIGGITVPATPNGPLVIQSGLQISTDLILRVQAVYVLGLFLVGKHRKKVQRRLAELSLVPGLSELFDKFIWKCQIHRNNHRHRLRGHNASCECSPEVALKIQFLRLVHSFCDHSEYKHLLLSKTELYEIKKINQKAGPLKVEGLDNVNRSLMCKGPKGLLTKIVDVMKKEPTASTFRFWLARAVESYLRGSTSYCDQIFLLDRGLLEHIATNIIDHDVRPKEILQSSFDLLGELIKFNCEAFKSFDKLLVGKEKFDKFVSTVNRNLVDSNMFIRSLVLSLEHFGSIQPEHKEYAQKESRLLTHVSKFELQMDYLRKFINLISVQNLTQENVSCLNTTLVFLMFANQKDKMPQYLSALAAERGGASGECSGPSTSILMKNFRDLLIFWQDHYLHKDKDCSALEKSSRINFDYWKVTVNALVSEDRNKTTAIIHYMEPDSLRDS